MRLNGRVAIVTGSGSGIGRSIALAFAKEGANVVICDLKQEAATSVLKEVKEYCLNGIEVKADISKEDDVRRLVHAVIDKYGKIDILVNNAGINRPCLLEETTADIWNSVMNVNLKGVLLCSNMFAKIMIEQKSGNIISIASMAGHVPYSLGNIYSASKAGVIMLTRQMALEWGKYNIRANSISPGLIRTPATEKRYLDPAQYTKRVEIVPIRRIGTPEDIAKAAVFLASDDSAYITGQDIGVDGGLRQAVSQLIPGRESQHD